MAITLHQILDAVEGRLDNAVGLVRSQTFDELTEGINSGDMPLLQVYPEALSPVDSLSGSTDRLTFQGGVRQEMYTIIADVYCSQRSHIGQDMSRLVAMVDTITTVLEAENSCPFFGLEGIKNFQWGWQRVLFEYATAQWIGFRLTLQIRTF